MEHPYDILLLAQIYEIFLWLGSLSYNDFLKI